MQSDLPPLSLPYRFDTTRLPRMILKCAAALSALMLLGAFINIAPFKPASVAGCLLVACMAAGFGIILYRKFGGLAGVVRREGIEVGPPFLFGIRADGPEGFFPIGGFRALCVEWRYHASAYKNTYPYLERIYFLGRDDMPDVLVVQLTNGTGRALARQFGAAFSLPVEERPAPGVHGVRSD